MVACQHKQQKAQLPPLAPSDVANIPPPSNAPSPPPDTIPTKPTQEAPTPPLPVQKPVARRRKPKPAETTEQAANPTPEVSAIGQLSSGDPADFRRQTEDSIASTEHRLQLINRNLDDTEKKTADHIREFIKEAKAALASGDVDGAHTLADKAHVLLAELTDK
jgi:hypothetical protein